jgi:hypothetical protein
MEVVNFQGREKYKYFLEKSNEEGKNMSQIIQTGLSNGL